MMYLLRPTPLSNGFRIKNPRLLQVESSSNPHVESSAFSVYCVVFPSFKETNSLFSENVDNVS